MARFDDLWSGYAREGAYGSWRFISIQRSDVPGEIYVWEEDDIRDDIDTLADLLERYDKFAYDLQPWPQEVNIEGFLT